MKMNVYAVSAFSKNNAGGNKAGVVLFQNQLTVAQKMRIAEILGFSETAFVTESDEADFKLEYYTTTDEVPLCGHATIATFSLMKTLGLVENKQYHIETKAGLLEIEVADDGLIMMQQNNPTFYETLTANELTECFGENKISKDEPIEIISTGLKDIILPIQNRDCLDTLELDLKKISDYSERKEVVGFHAFTLMRDTSEVDAVCRNFAPLYGIDEESATGTASCALASYLFKNGCEKNTYIFEQGYSLNSPSRIVVNLENNVDVITKIMVGGYGYIVSEVEIDV